MNTAGTIELRNMDRKRRRALTLFCAASLALHALALAVSPRSGTGVTEGAGAAPSVLHAALSPLHTAFESTPANPSVELVADAGSAPAPTVASASQGTSHNGEEPAAASGFTAGAFPLPDRWLSAEELSVRAEPLTHVEIPYPADIPERGVFGRVRLMLHIDERGVVRKARIEESLPEGVFDRVALEAWAEVPFSPAMKDGVTVKSRKLLEISFVP